MKETEQDMVYGLRPVMEAISSGKEIEKVLVQNGLSGTLASELKRILVDEKIPFQFVPPEKLNRVTRSNHQGVICFISPVAYGSIETLLPGIFESGRIPLLLLLDRITDVRNFGAIARTAECAGADAIIIPRHGAALISSDAVKTSAGALHSIPVCREQNLKLTIEYLKQSGVQILSCTEKGKVPFYKADLTIPTAIILGSEEDGVLEDYIKRSDHSISIPLLGKIGSLNVSVACGVFLFEAVKQRAN